MGSGGSSPSGCMSILNSIGCKIPDETHETSHSYLQNSNHRSDRRRKRGPNSFIDITKSSTNRIQNIPNCSFLPQAIAGDHTTRLSNKSALSPRSRVNIRVPTYVEQRRSSSGIQGVRPIGQLPTNGSSTERVLVTRVPTLPIIPNFVDHLCERKSQPLSQRNSR